MITKLIFYHYFKIKKKKNLSWSPNSTKIPVTSKLYEQMVAYIHTEGVA